MGLQDVGALQVLHQPLNWIRLIPKKQVLIWVYGASENVLLMSGGLDCGLIWFLNDG